MPAIFFMAFLALLPLGCGRRSPVIAKVGPLKITQDDFQKALADVAPGYQNYVMTRDGRRQFLDILIRNKLELAAAEASSVRKSPDYKTQAGELRSEESARLREALQDLLVRGWEEDLRRRGFISASSDEAESYWRKHPFEVGFRHILVASPKQAEQILKEIRAGADFSSLARKYSLDTDSALNGGRMLPALYGEVIPDLQEIVFDMRVGELSGPIKTKFGYHVLRKDFSRRVSFDKNEERFEKIIEKEKLDAYLRSLQSLFPVEVVDEQFK